MPLIAENKKLNVKIFKYGNQYTVQKGQVKQNYGRNQKKSIWDDLQWPYNQVKRGKGPSTRPRQIKQYWERFNRNNQRTIRKEYLRHRKARPKPNPKYHQPKFIHMYDTRTKNLFSSYKNPAYIGKYSNTDNFYHKELPYFDKNLKRINLY